MYLFTTEVGSNIGREAFGLTVVLRLQFSDELAMYSYLVFVYTLVICTSRYNRTRTDD